MEKEESQERRRADRERVARIVRRFSNHYVQKLSFARRAVARLGFPATEWAVWQLVAGPHGTTATWICWQLGIDQGLLSRILRDWEVNRGWVATRLERHDRRIKRILLTAAGWSMDRDLQRAANDAAHELLDIMSDADQRLLSRSMATIARLLDDLEKPWRPPGSIP